MPVTYEQIAAWQHNLDANRALVRVSAGPRVAAIVAGSRPDSEYWHQRSTATRSEIFRSDGATSIIPVTEEVRKGNFLGTLNAWRSMRAAGADGRSDAVALVSMLLGQGTRLSPFTQVLGNCKPRLPTPFRSEAAGDFLTIGELSNLYSNLIVHHLNRHGFRGLVVKWGDEIIIPGLIWSAGERHLRDADAMRFVSIQQPTATLALEKDWVLVNDDTRAMVCQLPRQEHAALMAEVERRSGGRHGLSLAINLGSLAVRYELLEVLDAAFATEVTDSTSALDWDPYLWIALGCTSTDEWQTVRDHDARSGGGRLARLETQLPGFFEKVLAARRRYEAQVRRPLAVQVLDFGDPLWIDLGQHWAVRANLERILAPTPDGRLVRSLFGLPDTRDASGNTIVGSRVPASAHIRDSIILDAVIEDPSSALDGAIVVGGRFGRLTMPHGGAALLCHALSMAFDGPGAVALGSIGADVRLGGGDRHATVVAPDGRLVQLYANEAVTVYSGATFDQPLPPNAMSFAAAGELVAGVDYDALDAVRRRAIETVFARPRTG